ncbi:MAG TPA: rRNA maturation RNase YbeY [Acholeplasmatales bacterium]|nr:MAG: rRNA maturation RNase YbeY [Tenericutes bacterium GWF2_57_13]HAQ56086.1 rRNA maturation RNase YbeY [Acholeplasmatales bacterium]
MLRINFVNQFDAADQAYLPTLEKVLKQAYKTLRTHGRKIISVILVNDSEIQRINRDYRKIDRITDVITFDNQDGGIELGDVFIAIPRTKEQAASYGHSFERELGFLAVHGYLHCSGYDHQTPEEEKTMFALQEEILAACELRRN